MNKNEITGDTLVSKQNTESYRSGWDRIFGEKLETNTNDHNGLCSEHPQQEV